MTSGSLRSPLRGLFASATLAGASLLVGCDGVGPPNPPIELTATAADSTTSVDVGHPATVTFTVANPSSRAQDNVQVLVGGSGPGNLRLGDITCTAQSGTCPRIDNTNVPAFSMAAGASLTFTATMNQIVPAEGDEEATISVWTTDRSGILKATAHMTAVDGRNGAYEIFATSGLRTNVDVRFKGADSTFAVSSHSVDQTMKPQTDFFTFPSGGHLASGPDLLVGQADFGQGLDDFIAVRNLVTDLSALDGTSFSTFNLAKGAAASNVDAVTGMAGPLDVWQVAIAGTTMTVCADVVGSIASCDPSRVRQYVLTTQAGGGPVFTAMDAAHNDSFTFQVARSGSSLIYLRADVAPNDALFSIGFANAQLPSSEHDGLGLVAGKFGVLNVLPSSARFLPLGSDGLFAMPTYTLGFGGDTLGIPGLVHATRSTDGVEVYLLQQGALSLTATPTGELGFAVDRLLY